MYDYYFLGAAASLKVLNCGSAAALELRLITSIYFPSSAIFYTFIFSGRFLGMMSCLNMNKVIFDIVITDCVSFRIMWKI